ncbi:MAG: hypothetical protein EPN25_08910 [Nitrospirae bacterium]|nr:MAG: hypothetical protein EPN25_08910 [Nitrospirota bacterium]
MLRLYVSLMVFCSLYLSGVCGISFASAEDVCLGCHEKKTPGIVNHWKESAHFKKQVGCADCHGSDIEAGHKREAVVDAAKCGTCHKKTFDEHSLSRHSKGLRTGQGCTRNMAATDEQKKSCSFCHAPGSTKPFDETECAMFLAQSKDMQAHGCSSCHRVEDRCDTCHTKHGTDLSLARMPGTCGTCHMGPDHAQYEMWDASSHGVIFRARGEKDGPSCVTCHMNRGSHNVSRGIATGLPEALPEMKKQERDYMVSICSGCHTSGFSARNLAGADNIEQQSRKIVEEARVLVEELYREDLLFPPPSERPSHPLFGKKFVIGPHMLYENLSLSESLFFRMKQFYYMNTVKGAFHQNPDYTHWYGNAPLKLALSELKSEAASLRRARNLKDRLDNLLLAPESPRDDTGDVRKALRELRERMLRGAISGKEYDDLKKKALDEKGL